MFFNIFNKNKNNYDIMRDEINNIKETLCVIEEENKELRKEIQEICMHSKEENEELRKKFQEICTHSKEVYRVEELFKGSKIYCSICNKQIGFEQYSEDAIKMQYQMARVR